MYNKLGCFAQTSQSSEPGKEFNMKTRWIAFLLTAALLAGLASCGSSLEEEGAGTADVASTAAVQTDPETLPDPAPVSVPDPVTKEKLAAIPVANEAMTEDELRKICVDFCVLQGSFQWTPNQDFRYSSSNKDHQFLKGVLYGGLPYTHTSSNLYTFMDYYDEETGVLDVSEVKNAVGQYLGNDCADAVFWGWARVSNTISYVLTDYMVPKYGCLKLGDHVYDETADSFHEQPTKEICQANGAAVMNRSYALMKPADGMVTWNGAGHARMVMENHPVPNGDSYDSAESYVICVEQYSKLDPTLQGEELVQVVGGIRNRYTYADLFRTGYLPIRIAELSGEDPVEKAEVKLEPNKEGTDVTDLESLLDCNLVSNYRLSKVAYSVTDQDGKTIYESQKYCGESSMYGIPMGNVINRSALRRNLTADETYTLTVTALVSTGETLDVFTCPLSLN